MVKIPCRFSPQEDHRFLTGRKDRKPFESRRSKVLIFRWVQRQYIPLITLSTLITYEKTISVISGYQFNQRFALNLELRTEFQIQSPGAEIIRNRILRKKDRLHPGTTRLIPHIQ